VVAIGGGAPPQNSTHASKVRRAGSGLAPHVPVSVLRLRSRTLLPTMSEPPLPPDAGYHNAVGPAQRPEAGAERRFDFGLAAIGKSLLVAAGTALLGLAAGFLWSLLAPRAVLVMVSPGAAGLVQVETNAFIVADATFCLIVIAGGVVSGALGYLLAVRRHGPLAMAGVLAGALAAGYLARWVGEQAGLTTFHHLLATLPVGSRLRDSLMLRASGALAFWPIAAGMVAGGLTALSIRGNTGAAGSYVPLHSRPLPPPPWLTPGR
jgi:hypothetical protein